MTEIVPVVFDAAKRSLTLAARGLDMADCAQVFDGPTVTFPDVRTDFGEDRWISFGLLDRRMIVVVRTWRSGQRRIISMRRAVEREQRQRRHRLDRSG